MSSPKLSQRLWKIAPRASQLTRKEQIRQLSLHEYQSQDILRHYGVPVPRGRTVNTAKEARLAAQELGPECMVKAQVLGRGRAAGRFDNGLRSGVQAVSTPDQAEHVASRMLKQNLVTKYNSPHGHFVDKLYVTEAATCDAHWYLAMTIDRENYRPAIIVSKVGGVELHDVVEQRPESLFTFNFGLSEGITDALVQDIQRRLGTTGQETESLTHILTQMHSIFRDREATHLEINPLGRCPDGSFTSLSANFAFDKAAEQRQADMFALRDKTQEVPDEVEAEKHGLVYVRMDGNIGNVVNGAGLSMATNDAIGFHGGSSANFLDAGGKATKDTMMQAFRIITRDKRVRAILVNIYGGITHCDMIAESIVGAASELDIRVPMVVRLQGTNSEKGVKMLKDANLGLVVESDFGQAAKRAVELAQSVGGNVDGHSI
ncbi:succinyl-CoA synthetase beta chain [Metarhizium album ARSEF 1941]|uniref:Succinyl-CoA synthetase beta chain n=1 Tax=Metarhizium album (strain ARSEF 1941) TaxID=1081103 RepID=A0A0B2WNG5_METAS|nr:succinyl-CoA synthetase beta chain [Metarhizium album ARSEF 1941]KHN95194.1 succinyl-CoA synthetase beta chain [Metarhizium album ARSEF 1941]